MSVRGERGRGPWLAAAACLVVVLGVGAALVLNNNRTSPTPVTATPPTFAGPVDPYAGPPWDMVGQQVPDFTGTTTDGSTVTPSSMKGSWVIIDFSSTWCGPCQLQTPELIALTTAHPDVKIITVAFSDDLGAVDSLLTSQGVTWPIVAVDPNTLVGLHVTGATDHLRREPRRNGDESLRGLHRLRPARSIDDSDTSRPRRDPPVSGWRPSRHFHARARIRRAQLAWQRGAGASSLRRGVDRPSAGGHLHLHTCVLAQRQRWTTALRPDRLDVHRRRRWPPDA